MNKDKLQTFCHSFLQQLHFFVTECLSVSVLLNLFVEACSRESLIQPFFYLFKSPLVFLCNTLLIAVSLSVSFFFKRRNFARFLLCVLWLGIGITDFVLLQFRTTPFTAVDLLLLDSAIAILDHYLSPFQIILVVAALLAVTGFGIFLFLRAKKAENGTSPLYAGCVFLLLLFLSLGTTRLFVSCHILERNFGNLAQGFHTNGLPYCFYNSIFNTGISKPVSYSKEEIDRILSSITAAPDFPSTDSSLPSPEATSPADPDSDISSGLTPPSDETPEHSGKIPTEHPNFVFVQLESFFDPTHISGIELSDDPIPTFRNLKEQCSSGFLTVPSVGAGTANTEFELLTGINLDFFGPGEYPYKTILKDTACESIAYNLASLGLTAHAIHNNDGTFYERHIVFSSLGFHTFTPIEYMGLYETTPLGWAKDEILTSQIVNALSSTEGQDFVYAISVQAHGSYPEEALLENPAIDILALPEELKDSYYGLLYFIHQLNEVDAFLSGLISALENYDEEVVLVLYGDHLPSFPFTDTLMTSGSVYCTEYVIWSNRTGTDIVKKDLEAYALSAHVLDLYDIHEGLFTRFHQTQTESESYLEDMELLAYDVLYGNYESYEGQLPYEATDMQLGIEPIYLRSAHLQSNVKEYYCLYIYGENFTPYSIAYVNGENCNTTYINPHLLSVSGFEPEEELEIRVAQVGADSYPLSFTEPLTVFVNENTYPEN